MKVVKITKVFRNGTVENFLVLPKESYSDEAIDFLVEEWCENEPSGLSNGYSYKWELVEDKELINTILNDRIIAINNHIAALKSEIQEIEKYLNKKYVDPCVNCELGMVMCQHCINS